MQDLGYLEAWKEEEGSRKEDDARREEIGPLGWWGLAPVWPGRKAGHPF